MLDAPPKRRRNRTALHREEHGSNGTDPVNIGQRLRRLRRTRKLTLQDVSVLTGVSGSAFSKIERGEISPTMSTMQRIARGLDIELVNLLKETEAGLPTQLGGRRSISRAGSGSELTTGTCNNILLCSELKDKRATPILTTVKARATSDYPAWASSNAEIFLMVLKGSIIVHSRVYEPLELNEGDSIYYDALGEHTWTSKGPSDAVVLWVLMD